jgi:osmotically-inducible protein OsmY
MKISSLMLVTLFLSPLQAAEQPVQVLPRQEKDSFYDRTIEKDKVIGKQEQSDSMDDQELRSLIEKELKKNMPSVAKDVQVQVLNKIVILKGSVEDAKTRQELKDQIRKIKGVTNIDDQIEVKNRDPKTIKSIDSYYLNQKRVSQAEMYGPAFKDDGETLERVRDFLSSHPAFKDVSADIYEGNIQLSGTVRSQSEKDSLERQVKQVRGVRGVETKGLRITGVSY